MSRAMRIWLGLLVACCVIGQRSAWVSAAIDGGVDGNCLMERHNSDYNNNYYEEGNNEESFSMPMSSPQPNLVNPPMNMDSFLPPDVVMPPPATIPGGDNRSN